MTTPHNEVSASNDLLKNNARLVRLRWIGGLAVLVITPIDRYVVGVGLPMLPLFALGLFILAYNALFWRALARFGTRRASVIAVGQVALDWLALTLLVHLTGGVESLATHFFLFYILLAPILLPERAVTDLRYIVGKLSFFTTFAVVTAALMIPIVREFRERERQIVTLYQNTGAFSSSLDLSHVLDRLALSVTRALRAKGALIWLAEGREADASMAVAAAYGLSKGTIDRLEAPGRLEFTDTALQDGKPAVIDDLAQAADPPSAPVLLAEGARSALSVPLEGRRGSLGLLQVYGRAPGCFQEKEVQFVTALAQQGAAAIENALAFDELRQADASKSQFVRAVTHELRSPVAAAQSLLRAMLFEAHNLSDEQREDLGCMAERLDALKMLVDDLLDLAAGKVEGMEGKLEPVSLEAAVRDVVDQLASQAVEKRIDLEMDYVPPGMTVVASAGGLKRVFLNLIGNAVKYTPEGGHVHVRIKRQNKEVVVEVADSGVGIPERDLPHLFEEFFRARNVKEAGIVGTGLGLSIVKDLVVRYGGHVTVQSVVGEGSTFTVTLPLSEQ
ncbi:MAG: GAF domain-containing sensor histidine kinase [Chloroflexota bacterium]